jgi:predicted nucleic acid-binding Zn finger protein
MTLRLAEHRAAGIHTFYVASDSKPGTEYCIQHIRKPGMNRWQCSCPQFFFRCAAKRRHCKHVRFVRHGAKEMVAVA